MGNSTVRRRLALTCIAATAVVSMILAAREARRTFATPARTPPRAVHRQTPYAGLPLGFEANLGQVDKRVKFVARGSRYNLLLTSDGATLEARPRMPASAREFPSGVVNLRLREANPNPRIEGQDKLTGKSNYFIGNHRAEWRRNIPRYGRVAYRAIYPGVDLIFYGNQGQLEHDFVIAPGADLHRIRFELQGATAMEIGENGDLVAQTLGGTIRQLRPIVYQDWNGSRHFLPGRYVLFGANQVGFEVAGYRADTTLVIDPVLAYSSYLGGSDRDAGFSVAVDAGGNVYVSGATASVDFPTRNPEQPNNAGGYDAFVTKLDPTGNVVFSTYLGGSGDENNFHSGVEASGVAVDSVGNVYLVGRTSSVDFPIVNGFLPNYAGGDYDAFVAELSADGSTLLYSTYLGGSANDSGNGIAVDSVGAVYVTGGTRSDTDFPITAGAYQRFSNGQLDAFVTKIDPTQVGLASRIYSTFLGGTGNDRGTAIAVDAFGNAYVTGRTDSTDFPTNPPQSSYNGAVDAFVTELSADGSALNYSIYLGGSGLDVGNGIVVDSAGNAYVTGETGSPDFPVTNGYQTAKGGSSDAFVTEIAPGGTVVVYSSFFGGAALDRGTGIALDPTGHVLITGETSSDDFPQLNAFQTARAGGKDAFLAQFDTSQVGQASLLYSSCLGGSANDIAYGMAVDPSGNAWVVGQTSSTDFPVVNATYAPYQGGPTDAFISEIANPAAYPSSLFHSVPSVKTSGMPVH